MAKKAGSSDSKSSSKSKSKEKPDKKSSVTSAKAASKVLAKSTAKPIVKAAAKQSPKVPVKILGKSATTTAAIASVNNNKIAKTEKTAKKKTAPEEFEDQEIKEADVATDLTDEVSSSGSETEVEKLSPEIDQEEKTGPSPKVIKAKKPAKISAKMKLEAANLAELNKKWQELKGKFAGEKAPNYNMNSTFEANTPIQHKIFGWGYVTNNENDRLEILFEVGLKHLISNYRP